MKDYRLDTTGWVTPTSEQRQTLDLYFGFTATVYWETCGFLKYGSGSNVQMRVISADKNLPTIRPNLNGFYAGGITVIFSINDMAAHEKL